VPADTVVESVWWCPSTVGPPWPGVPAAGVWPAGVPLLKAPLRLWAEVSESVPVGADVIEVSVLVGAVPGAPSVW